MNEEPTELTKEDIDAFVKSLMDGKFYIKKRSCWKCSKEFLPNYHDTECDECYFF